MVSKAFPLENMKVLILAGGRGTRLGEETGLRPKPMVEIGNRPILWHIMKTYAHYGFCDFVVLAGYKGGMIRDWFVNYGLKFKGDTVDLGVKHVEMTRECEESWRVTVLDTGLETMTGSRIKKAASLIGDEQFLLTYGDGVSDVNLAELVEAHNRSGRMVTLTAVQPAGRWGALDVDGTGRIVSFEEKPQGDGGWINGGFFVCQPEVFKCIGEGDGVIWERGPLRQLVAEGELGCYKHHGFWQPMDMLRDKILLNELWNAGRAPWKVWE